MSQALQVDSLPTEITLSRDYYYLQWEIVEWCERHFGPGGWYRDSLDDALWFMTGAFGTSHFYFKHPEHAMMFKLRWYSTC